MDCIDRVGRLAVDYQLVLNQLQLEQLSAYLRLLMKWNRAYNLTGAREAEELARLHILDSLTVAQHIHGDQIIDVGSGAGFPGIPLAIARPEKRFTLLDANSKKTRFLQAAKTGIGLSGITILCQRLEKHSLLYSSVVCRALGKPANIIQPLSRLAEGGGKVIIMAGHIPDLDTEPSIELEEIVKVTPPLGKEKRHLIILRKLY